MKTIKHDNIWSITSFLENKQYNFDKKEILNILPINLIDEAVESIPTWKTYSPTPLIRLNKLEE